MATKPAITNLARLLIWRFLKERSLGVVAYATGLLESDQRRALSVAV